MSDLRDLYQDVILDHNKKPRNFGRLQNCTHDAHGHNPLCGDDYEIMALVEDGIVKDVSFEGSGCAISKAAASMMTSRVKGKPVDDALRLIEDFRTMMVGQATDDTMAHLGHLRVFEGVAQLPNRIKCAVLPWHTLNAALVGSEAASTEGENDEWEGA
jgi:nitrogen fixation NifU-like protein